VIVDHKAVVVSASDAAAKAATFAGQLRAYALAIGAVQQKGVAGTFVHFPVAGLVVEVMGAPSPGEVSPGVLMAIASGAEVRSAEPTERLARLRRAFGDDAINAWEARYALDDDEDEDEDEDDYGLLPTSDDEED